MEIENLTKSQIVLLTLLVSFVTSIATGITTVALMDQTPPAITQTINRVVEHTVERVVPDQQSASAAQTVKETVIVKHSDAVASAVSEAHPSTVRISKSADGAPVAVGVAMTGSLIITDAAVISDGASYNAILSDGSTVPLVVSAEGSNGYLVALSPATSSPSFTSIAVQKTVPNLGESVIALTGLKNSRIASGIVTSIVSIPGATASSTEQAFDSSIDLGPLAAGSVFISTDGALVGIYSSVSDSIMPSSVVSKLRAAASESSATSGN